MSKRASPARTLLMISSLLFATLLFTARSARAAYLLDLYNSLTPTFGGVIASGSGSLDLTDIASLLGTLGSSSDMLGNAFGTLDVITGNVSNQASL